MQTAVRQDAEHIKVAVITTNGIKSFASRQEIPITMKLFILSLFAVCVVASASADGLDILHVLGGGCDKNPGGPIVHDVLEAAKPVVTLLDKTGRELLGDKNWELLKNSLCKDADLNSKAAKCLANQTKDIYKQIQCLRTAGVRGLDDVKLVSGPADAKVCQVVCKTIQPGTERPTCEKLYKIVTKLIGLCAPTPSCGCGEHKPVEPPTCGSNAVHDVVEASASAAASVSVA